MAATMAASSIFQRSSWKLAQDTPMAIPSAEAADPVKPAAATAAAMISLFIVVLPKI
jgi:hypothetical protein